MLLLGEHGSGIANRYTRHAARMPAAEQAAIRHVRQLFDKHDKYVNRNRHAFMFFSMMRSQHMLDAQASPHSVESALHERCHRCCCRLASGDGVIRRGGEHPGRPDERLCVRKRGVDGFCRMHNCRHLPISTVASAGSAAGGSAGAKQTSRAFHATDDCAAQSNLGIRTRMDSCE